MKNLTTMLACVAVLHLAGCDDGNGDDDEDTTTDTAVEDTVEDTVVADTEEDVPEDVPMDEETDGPMVCEDDATHHYIDVSGTITALPAGDVEGLYVAAISPLDALGSDSPTPLATGTTDADGNFTLECINTVGVMLGLVILVDDNPEDGVAGSFFPTGTGIQAWTDPTTAVDEDAATAMAVTNTLVGGLETLTSIDATADGFVMGLVVDGATGAPIDGAEVSGVSSTIAVAYPNADFSGLETDDSTSANGSYVVDQELGLSALTATATGYAFGEHQAATKEGFCYFQMMTGTAE